MNLYLADASAHDSVITVSFVAHEAPMHSAVLVDANEPLKITTVSAECI